MNEQPSARMPRTAARGGDGTVIAGRYVIQRVIARGGMATVYLAEDNLLNRPVAVKVLSGDVDQGDQDAFLQEARAVAKLSHPNIVDVYDAGVEGSLRYIVMQYVPGDTLRDIIRREAPLDPRRAAELTVKLADALNYGHTRGIVHCDMKPGNVLLGDHGEPKIVDFGIAQSLTQTVNLSDTVAGTVGYISPEQVEGRSIDGRTDVYSLAAVLYEMLSGAPPFAGEDLQTVVTQRLVKTPLPLRERNPFVPEEIEEIVMRGLARDPATRYPTAKAFSDALRGYLAGQTDVRTRRAARPAEGATERIAVPQRSTRVVPQPSAPLAAEAPGRRPWLFLTIAGTLLAVVVALVILLAMALTDGGSSGAAVAVPPVTGQRLDDAADQIRGAGLRVRNVELRSNPAPFGTVVDQRPAAGETLREGEDVDLTVSVGSASP
jgi:eukaryotic-like serine/threonine-protein kinase